MADNDLRPVWADVDLEAIRSNVRRLRAHVAPAALLAVVKADGYGHGAVPVARAAIDAGATMLGVALVEEGVQLRRGGVKAPILVLSEPVGSAAPTVVAERLVPTVYTSRGIEALAKAVASSGAEPLPVQLKIDTGMHRVGCTLADACALAQQIDGHSELVLDGAFTHLAVADEPELATTQHQLEQFVGVIDEFAALGIRPRLIHAANTAGALAHPASRLDMVRVGIGMYGVAPSPALEGIVALEPALSVKARITFVKQLAQGSRLSYGQRYELAHDAFVATVPIGYADGVPRSLAAAGGEVLVGGQRCPIAGTVTMDQIMIDLGPRSARPGDEVVLLGRQGDERITAQDWAERIGTIAYEILCGIGGRVPRHYSGGPS